MCYSGTTGLGMVAVEGTALQTALVGAGWTGVTALCVGIFCICHFPCSTALLTIRKETGDKGLTLFSALFPTLIGILLCAAIHLVSKIFV
jgi:ferrous iron transport protein B